VGSSAIEVDKKARTDRVYFDDEIDGDALENDMGTGKTPAGNVAPLPATPDFDPSVLEDIGFDKSLMKQDGNQTIDKLNKTDSKKTVDPDEHWK
jgi:hypothetical protein